MRKLSTVKKLALVVTAGVLATGSLTACLPSVDKADAKPSATSSAVGAKKPSASASSDSKDMLTKNIEIGKATVVKSHLGYSHVRFPVTNKNKNTVRITYNLALKVNTKTDNYGDIVEEEKNTSRVGLSSFCFILSPGETCEADIEITSFDFGNLQELSEHILDARAYISFVETFDSDTWFDCTDAIEVKYGKNISTDLEISDFRELTPGLSLDGSAALVYIFTNKTRHYIKTVRFATIYRGESYVEEGLSANGWSYIEYIKPGEVVQKLVSPASNTHMDDMVDQLFSKPDDLSYGYEKYGFQSYQEILDLRQTRAYCSIDKSKK